ncbi:MAG: hypothetical protein KC583_03050, partial [Myxococcales bacterium]|nr:hypothetical protein [Myxococcales bacterium]
CDAAGGEDCGNCEADCGACVTCGDGVCDACEGGGCPVDCGPAPPPLPPRRYDAFDQTITVQVHGFSAVNDAEFDDTVYGAARSAGGQGRALRLFRPDLVDGEAHPEAPDQLIGVEYYGRQPPDWMTPDQIAAVDAFDPATHEALPRYAHIVAFFVRHRMALSGARYVNFVCHSMGCHVIRYLLEHDLEGLASDGVVARWYTVAGVLAGARLARLFDNPTIRDAATLLALNTSDFVHMHPDYVVDNAAVWDHRPREANSPLLAGILMHHTVGTDPRVSETANIVRLLDLNNPGDEPNDGIMYTLDEFFHDQAAEGRFVAADGRRLRPTRSHQHLDHFLISDSEATGALGAAALFGGRKVYLTLERVELLDDREQDDAFDFSEEGQPPAELAVEVEVAFDGVRVHQQHLEDRSPELARMAEGEDRVLDLRVFEGPVPDDLDALDVHLELLEVDAYPRFGVLESLFDAHERLVDFRGSVALRDDTLMLESQFVRAEISVRVVPLY